MKTYNCPDCWVSFWDLKSDKDHCQDCGRSAINKLPKPNPNKITYFPFDLSKESACDSCLSNPKNGGSGFCNCILGNQTVY